MNYETTVNASSDGEAAEGERLAGAENKNRRRMLIAVAVIVLLMLAAIAHFVRNNKEPDFAAREGQAPTVTVAVPGTTLVQRQIQATGTLAARRAMPVGVVGDGGRVRRGCRASADRVGCAGRGGARRRGRGGRGRR